ncbi:MAG: RDD family protein [Candidatus Methylacidiphilales bacterium]|nr:RDD family protein [Candidatus Methylacidiphilales bacterium]
MQQVSLWDESATQLATPEQVDLKLEIANVGSRGLALLFDLLVRYSVVFVLYIMTSLASGYKGGQMDLGMTGFTVLFILIVFVSEWFYFTLFEWLWNGQTPGKRLMNLRVIKMDGSPVGVLEVFLRNFLRPIDTTAIMALVGMAFIFFHPRGQRPGDLAARTLVIREIPIDWSIFLANPEPEPGSNPVAITRIVLAPNELELLQRYLHRAARMDASVKDGLATQIKAALMPAVRSTDLQTSPLPAQAWLEELSRRV